MEKASGYDPTAGKVIIDEHLGHPGIRQLLWIMQK